MLWIVRFLIMFFTISFVWGLVTPAVAFTYLLVVSFIRPFDFMVITPVLYGVYGLIAAIISILVIIGVWSFKWSDLTEDG